MFKKPHVNIEIGDFPEKLDAYASTAAAYWLLCREGAEDCELIDEWRPDRSCLQDLDPAFVAQYNLRPPVERVDLHLGPWIRDGGYEIQLESFVDTSLSDEYISHLTPFADIYDDGCLLVSTPLVADVTRKYGDLEGCVKHHEDRVNGIIGALGHLYGETTQSVRLDAGKLTLPRYYGCAIRECLERLYG
ncbi:MAG: hypothetical protein ACQESG_03750 [Nanobdellota archaeon]